MEIEISNRFRKEYKKAKETPFFETIRDLIHLVGKNPFQNPPPYEKLSGSENTYSRRISRHHRFLYLIKTNKVILLRCWGHYE